MDAPARTRDPDDAAAGGAAPVEVPAHRSRHDWGRGLFHAFNATWGVLAYHFLVPRGTVDSPYRNDVPESFPADCRFHERIAE